MVKVNIGRFNQSCNSHYLYHYWSLTILGIMGGEFVGFETFTKGDGPILGGNLGGSLLSILGVFLVAGFSFQGTELIGITAGESENPERAVPKAIKQVFWRILLFYILAIFVIGVNPLR